MHRLSHPNMVRAVPLPDELQCLTSDMPLLCMEFCSGGDLRQVSTYSSSTGNPQFSSSPMVRPILSSNLQFILNYSTNLNQF